MLKNIIIIICVISIKLINVNINLKFVKSQKQFFNLFYYLTSIIEVITIIKCYHIPIY